MNSHADTEQTRAAAQTPDNDLENDFEDSEEFLEFVSGDMFEEESGYESDTVTEAPENNIGNRLNEPEEIAPESDISDISTEAPDVVKELGADETGVAFTEVTLDNNNDKVEFITGVNVTEDNIEETEGFLDFVTGNDSAAVNVQADRYVVGNNDNVKDATAEQLSYIRANKDKVMEKATALGKNHFAVVAAEINADRKAVSVENEKAIPTKSEPVKSEAKEPKQSEKAEKKPRGKRPDIIGSVKYDEIGDKEYFKMSAPEAREKSELLKGSGVKFSGRIYEDGKATLTVEKADVPKFRKITERKPSVIGEIADIKAKQKSEPKKNAPAKSRQEEL